MRPRYAEFCFLLFTLGMLSFFQSALSSGGCPRTQTFYTHQDEGSYAVGVKHKRESKARGSKWRLEVVHRDTLLPANAQPSGGMLQDSGPQRWEETRRRDAARLRRLEQQIERRLNGSYVKVAAEKVKSGVASGVAMGMGEYFTRIGVGTPATYQYMVLDTGSDVTWIQCAPCRKCSQQVDPIFNPASSASFSAVRCNSEVCSQVDVHACSRSGGCAYKVDYGSRSDGSYTIGDMATETLTFDDSYVPHVAIGCGYVNIGLFVGAAGLLGLGAGSLSLPSQLRTQLDGVFSYCLVDWNSNSTGTLEFGAQSVPLDTFFTPMEQNSRLPTFYYLSLAAITVGCTHLDSIPPNFFSIDTSGRGGVILDSVTTLTYLQTAAYEAMRDAFIAGTGHLPRAEGVSVFDTCYDLSDRDSVMVPAVDFHFSNGESLSLPASNYLVRVDTMGTHCFAFVPTESLSIMGNIQQQHIGVSFDSNNGLIGFALDQC